MTQKKSHFFYSANITQAGREEALRQLRLLTDKWIDEQDLFYRLGHAAGKFVAGEVATIRVDIEATLTGSGRTEHVELGIDGFEVFDTEPDVHVLLTHVAV